MNLTLTVNGETREACNVWPGESLLHVLRERLGLPGSKNACEQGECGSCTVHLDGVPVCACLMLAAQAENHDVRTVEGLAAEAPDPLQEAFAACGAVQCGFCTPGLIMAARALIDSGDDVSDAAIREALSGNVCRCTGYEKVLAAVRQVAERR